MVLALLGAENSAPMLKMSSVVFAVGDRASDTSTRVNILGVGLVVGCGCQRFTDGPSDNMHCVFGNLKCRVR